MPRAPLTDRPDAGSLTCIRGLRVGHHQRFGRGWCTGTTVVLAPAGVVAAVDVRGGGPGTRETDALAPHNLVDRIHAVCLTGGSAYGLAAADGVMAHLERAGLGVAVGPNAHDVVPVVPTAVIFDLGRGGVFTNRPGPEFGERAARATRTHDVARGSVGAGTGARTRGLQGGVGMSSTEVALTEGTARVAAIAVVNASGSLFDPSTGLPWLARAGLESPRAPERATLARLAEASLLPLNTTIGVVATDAALSRAETSRLAQSAHDGLARAIRPAHGLTDGDTVFGLSTGDRELTASTGELRAPGSRAHDLNALFAGAADAFGDACVDAVVTATSRHGIPAYRDVCPSAYR